jgi:hypothetical protein
MLRGIEALRQQKIVIGISILPENRKCKTRNPFLLKVSASAVLSGYFPKKNSLNSVY